MHATNSRLSAGHVKEYRELLESLSELVLAAVKCGNLAGVRRWASSLAHVANVLLDDRKHGRAA